MKDHAADLMLPRSPVPARGRAAAGAMPSRFSPLNAPQRAAVAAFCEQSRAWGLRQAARTYRHLPEEVRAQAVDQAALALRSGAPPAVDRRTLQLALADELTTALRRAHVGWCLNQSSAVWRGETSTADTEPADDGDPLGAFIDQGLGGLERAVLQLEIGAGRDGRTVRAALRLGPRQYARHREQGLGKLRDAIAGRVVGRACDDHAGSVVLAATGDQAAADRLGAGPARCRSCAREARRLRQLLHQRLALAPWPLAIKPAGVLAAKLGALGAVVGKGGAAVGVGGSGAGAVAAVMAATAVVSAGLAAAQPQAPAPTAGRSALATPAGSWTAAAAASPARTGPAAPERPIRSEQPDRDERDRADRPSSAHRGGNRPPVQAPPAPAATSPTAGSRGTGGLGRDAGGVVGTVRDTAPPVAPFLDEPVDDTLAGVQQAADALTGAVDDAAGRMLAP